jgi:type II secretory pathway pseudopilin PulG
MMKISRSRVAGSKLAARQSALRTALRSVERERQAAERAEADLQRQVRADLGEWPSPAADGDELAGPDYWPGPDDPFAALDAGDTRAVRDRWRKELEGEPPWASVA